MDSFASFDASAAHAARHAALLRAAESESETTGTSSSGSSSESEGERERGAGDESGLASSSDDDKRAKETITASEQHERGRRLKEKRKETMKKEKKIKEKKPKKKETKSKKKKKKKRRRSSRSKSPQRQPRPPERKPPLRLPAPASYAPRFPLPDPSAFSTVQDAVSAIDDAIIMNGEGEEQEQANRIVASVRLLLAAGHAEAAAARVAAAAEFYFLRPRGLSNSPEESLMESFQRFWESGAALACEEEEEEDEEDEKGERTKGGGWRRWFESRCLPLPPPLPSSSKKITISGEDAGLAAEIAAEVDARVATLLPEGDATFPASLASRWSREERRAASLAWRPLRGPRAVAALAALSAEEAEGDPLLSSAFAPFASVRSAVCFAPRGPGVAAASAVKEMLSVLGADLSGGGREGEHEVGEQRRCLASAERRRFLSRLLAALVSSSVPSLLSDDAEVCWAALEIEAAVAAHGEEGGQEEEIEEGKPEKTRNWARARAAAKSLLASSTASGNAAAPALWRAYARLQAASGAKRSSSLKVTTTLLAALSERGGGGKGGEGRRRQHALSAAVEAADSVGGGRGASSAHDNALAVLLVAAASGIAPAEVAVSPESGGAPTEEARGAALSALETMASSVVVSPSSSSPSSSSPSSIEAFAAIAAAEALLLLLPRPQSPLSGAEAAARLAEAADKAFGSLSSPSSSSSSRNKNDSSSSSGRAFEWLVLRRCRLFAKSATPSEARAAVLEALERFPDSTELVDLLAEIGRGGGGSGGGGGGGGGDNDDDKSTLDLDLDLLRQVISASGSPRALLRALSRGSLMGTAAAASAMEHLLRKSGEAASHQSSSSSPALVRALARAEIAAAADKGTVSITAATSRARRVLLRGLAAFPWDAELYFDLVDPAALSEKRGSGEDTAYLPLPLLVPSAERAELIEAAADAGVLLGARVDVYETALAVAAEGVVAGGGVYGNGEEQEEEEEGELSWG